MHDNNDMKDLLAALTLIVIALFALIYAGIGKAADYHLLEVDKVEMEYKQHKNYRDAYFPQYETINGECTQSKECMKFGAALNFDLNLFRYKENILGWRNIVDMDSTDKQVRQVGWNWEAGLFFKKFEVFHRHHSRHVLEDINSDTRYPLRDEYVIKLKFFNREDK